MGPQGKVRLNIEHGVATMTLDRVQRRNALDRAMWEGIREAALEASAKNARVLIIVGAGEHFSSGMDLRVDNPLIGEVAQVVAQGEHGRADGEAVIRWLKSCLAPIRTFSGLSIAAIEGVCIGGAFEVALHCDVRVAARSAQVGLPETRWGMVPDLGGSTLLTRLVGPGRAALVIGSGRRLSADEGFALGMIEQLVAPHGALTAARALARDVCRCAPTATALALRQVRSAADGSLDAALEAETVAGARALASGEVAEGVRAFASHEAPQWSNIGPVLDSDSSSAR